VKKLFYNLLILPAALLFRHCTHTRTLTWALLFCPFLLCAQVPAIQWQHSFGGSNIDRASSVVQTADGGYIVAGWSSSADGDVTGNHSKDDYWIVKLDAAGSLQWQKSLGGSNNDEATSVIQTSDGGYIVAGGSASTDGDVTGNHGVDDYWIVKLGATGLIQWEKSLGGTASDQALSIQQTSDGGYIVAGVSASNDGDVTGNHGGEDYWIVKLDAAGSIQWQNSFGGSGDEQAFSIQQTTDGGYITAGVSASNDGDVTGNHGGEDYWIVKLSNAGNIQWEKSLGGSGNDQAYVIQQVADSGYIVAGYSTSTDGDVTGNHGSGDYWIVKLTDTGSIQWQKSLGGSGNDGTYSIQQTADGGYIVAGWSNSVDGEVAGNHGDYDYWIVKLSGAGSIQWQKSLGGSGRDITTSAQQTPDGGYIIAGYSTSTDGDVTGNHGNQDYWIVKLGNVTSPQIVSPITEDLGSLGCDSVQLDTIEVRNLGSDTLAISSATLIGPNNITVISPVAFPDSIAPGDSLRFILKLVVGNSTSVNDTLSLANNDPIPGDNPWLIAIQGNAAPIVPLQLSLGSFSGSFLIGTDGIVYLIATPQSSVFIGDTITFTVRNDYSALQFDSVFSQWGTVIAVNVSDSVATVSLKIISTPITDTLAVIYYKTLIGTTLTPDVTLPSAFTTNGCTTASAAGSATIQLLPPGCELGTLSFNTSGLSMQPPYPNPTSGNTAIVYSTGETAEVNILVTDALGRTILTLVDAVQKPGVYYTTFDIRDLPGGIYFVRMHEGEYTSTEKLFLVR
jgi:hypothetical protein